MILKRKSEPGHLAPKYPGIPVAVDGTTAVVEMETAASEGAGAYPITPSTQMGEGWAAAVAEGRTNVNGRTLLFFEPEGEHAAAAVTAGMSMVGLRATNFSSGQGIAYMHESLYAAVGKRLTYVLNIAARAMTKHALNVHAGHDDYHAIDDTGFFQLFAKDPQEAADLNLIAHRVAELALNPGVLAQDGFLTSHVIESIRLPERELVREFLGDPADLIESPTPAQRWVFGERRRRIPELFDLDYPAMLGVVQNQDAYQQGVAAQRPFYFDHVAEFTDRAIREYAALTGRRYARATGYRLDDAEWVLVGQGSVVANCEAVVDHLRATRGLKVGVLNVTMFRPFPADLITHLLQGKQGVTVLERVDQPLAVEQPLLREIRAAATMALENGRVPAGRALPYRGLAAWGATEAPDFYSGTFGLGSRDLQPGDIVAAVQNMLEGGAHRRQFYLGIDFVRPQTRLPKLQIWQEQVLDGYPDIAGLSLTAATDVDLVSAGSTSIRIHSVGGWGAITMGKNLALTAADLFGLFIKANPKYGSEKKGQPTTFYATLAKEPIRLNCELKHVNVVLAPDPNVFRHSDPLAGLEREGVFVIQSNADGAELWRSLPSEAQQAIRDRSIRLYTLNAFNIAQDEASEVELRYRMQGAAFMGAFFRVSGLMQREGLDEAKLFAGIQKQLQKKFGKLGTQVVADNVRVIRRGFDEVRAVDLASLELAAAVPHAAPPMPGLLEDGRGQPGIGNQGRFWEQVCFLYKTGSDGIADPFAALSAMPATTSVIRDMTDVRFEVPEFIAANCTGCGQCWTQCPDSAIPGLVSEVEDVLRAAARTAANGRTFDRFQQIVKPLGAECRKLLGAAPVTSFGPVLGEAYRGVVGRMNLDPERRAALDTEFTAVHAALAEFPLARTGPFFDLPASRGQHGALLSITVNPDTCKGCNICVQVCPDDALRTVPQTPEIVDRLRRNWKLWEQLPDTPDSYVNVSNIEEGIGVLSSLLLKKATYRSMVGGDGACMGCGEKTVAHLVLSAVNALMLPRVQRYIIQLDDLISRVDAKARGLLAADVDLHMLGSETGSAQIAIEAEKKATVARLTRVLDDLKNLRWRYVEGPSGRGRASMAMANATGCSSVWGSTYPYNPYPFPWVNHLFQDAPSIAIGIFEGHMRKMADGFKAVRRAELELAGEYDAATHEPFFVRFDWHQFSGEEIALCPPIFATGGDGAMLDIGFQNLSRMLASGKPIRVMVLDTQVYSNTGGQACTSGFLGQVSDMAAYGQSQHGKTETRKELALLTMAHRNVFLLQSSQAAPSHLLAGVLRGLQSRFPSVFALHCPCPPEHGIGDDQPPDAAKLALESRCYPLLVYDPAQGPTLAERLSLDGNPSVDDSWPEYDLKHVDADGQERTVTLPLTTADWAATEARFKRHFTRMPADTPPDELMPFHEYVAAGPSDRDGKRPFIHVLEKDRRLGRLLVAEEVVRLAEDRLAVWSLLREMAGLGAGSSSAEAAVLEGQLEQLRAEYERKISDVKARYPAIVARRLAEGLLRSGNGERTIADLLGEVARTPGLAPVAAQPGGNGSGAAAPATPRPTATTSAVALAPSTGAAAVATEDAVALEPYIDSARCTACNECTAINKRLFAYNAQKQAYIKDPRAGTFKELVTAAERCPVRIIHPGTPVNPKEKDLDKWVERAKPFS